MNRPLPAVPRGTVLYVAGHKEQAFKWLDIARTEHAAEIVIAKTSAEFDPLRSDARFSQLLRRIGLPD